MPQVGVFCFTRDHKIFDQIESVLLQTDCLASLHHTNRLSDLVSSLSVDEPALVLVDENVGPADLMTAFASARGGEFALPFIVLSAEPDCPRAAEWFEAGIDDCVSPSGGWHLVAALRRGLKATAQLTEQCASRRSDAGTARLLTAVQELSLARDMATIQMVVKRAARDLTGADGATFVLRDGECCSYVDEDAVGPLWKGQRFPMSACISGWVMNNRQAVVIADIFNDPRVPVEAYRPTFVKSLAMVPIRTESPIGAIGNYWAKPHLAKPEELELLQALANTTSVAMENVRVYSELEQRVKDRTRLLEETNRELESFSFSVSHDLRSPLSSILAYAELLREMLGDEATPEMKESCQRIIQQSHRMTGLIRDLLRLGQVSRAELKLQQVDLSGIVREKLQQFADAEPRRKVKVLVREQLMADADPNLISVALENLLSNAWKYTGKGSAPQIEFGLATKGEANGPIFFVRDNGAGFNPRQADRLFAPFQRLHRQDEFPGVGVGLATVQRVIHKHGGRVWATSTLGEGATFYFTLPEAHIGAGLN